MNKIEEAAIIGLAIGDALGVPYEFQERHAFHCVDMIGYGTHDQPAGTWSDDTSMTIATCKSIKDIGHIDCEDIRKKFEDWYFNAAFTPFGEVFDCGNTCSGAICDKHGYTGINSNGNGSLMRILTQNIFGIIPKKKLFLLVMLLTVLKLRCGVYAGLIISGIVF